MQQAIRQQMDAAYQMVVNGEHERALQVLEQLVDRLDLQILEKKTQFLADLVGQIRNFMISDYELETLTALLCTELLIKRGYMVPSLYDSIKIGFSSKHRRIIAKTVQIIRLRPLQQQEYNVLLTIAMDYFKSRANKAVAILQFVEIFQLIPDICRFQLEQSGQITKEIWKYCIVREEEEAEKCIFLLCKLFPNVAIQQIDTVFKGANSKVLQSQGPSIRLLFQKHGREEFPQQFEKDMKYAAESYIKYIISKINNKDIEFLNEYFKLIAVLAQFTENLEVMLYQQIFDKLLANCYKVELFSIVRFIFKYCADGSKIRQFIPIIWLKYEDYIEKPLRKVSADLLEGLQFCTEHCRMNIDKNIDVVLQFYIIEGEITESFFEIVEILSEYETHRERVRAVAFTKISEYLTKDKYVVSGDLIVRHNAEACTRNFGLSFAFYIQLFLKMDFRYSNILEYVEDNIAQYLDSNEGQIRQQALEVILSNLVRIESGHIHQHVGLIKETVDFILTQQDDLLFIFGIEQLIKCTSLHVLLFSHYIEAFTAYLLDHGVDVQDSVLRLLGKLLCFDEAQHSCMQLRNVFYAKMNFLNNREFQENLYSNLLFIKMAIQHCAAFLREDKSVFDTLSDIPYQKLSEKESIALIQTEDQFVKQYELGANPERAMQYFSQFIHYYLNQDIYGVNINILRFLQRLVNSTGIAVAHYLLIPNLKQRLIYLIKNSKNHCIKEEAVNALVICGPINFDVALEQVSKDKSKVFFENSSMRQLIIAKYVERNEQDSELLTHGNIYFDDINQMLVDYDNIIYSKDSELIAKVDVLERVLTIIRSCLNSDEDLVLEQASNAFRLICEEANQDGMRLNVIQHVKNIAHSIQSRSDEATLEKLLINLTNTVGKIDHCVNIVEYDIVDACLAVRGGEEQFLSALSLLEETQLVLLQEPQPLEMYRKNDVIDLLIRCLLAKNGMTLCKRCLEDLLLFKSHFELNGYEVVPLLISFQKESTDNAIKLLCSDILLRFLCFSERREQLATIIFAEEIAILPDTENDECKMAILQLLVVCCINNFSLIQSILGNQCFSRISAPEMYDFVIVLHLVNEREINLAADELEFLFDKYCQFHFEDSQIKVQKLFKSDANIEIQIPKDVIPERLVGIFLQFQDISAPSEIVLPYSYGKNNMEQVEDKNDDIVFNLWEMSQCTNEKEWDEWFQKFVYHSIRLSNCKYLSFCSNLAEIDLQNEQLLFNSAILYNMQKPGKIEPRIQKLQEVINRVFHKNTPNNIQLCFMSLIDFLNKYEINTSSLINQDMLFDISEEYQAFTRSLRIRESECNLFRMNSYLDSLFECYRRLQFRDLASALLLQEERILDCAYLFYIHCCFSGLLKHIDDCKKTFLNLEAIEEAILKFQPPSIQAVESIYPENKQLFFENLFLDLKGGSGIQYTSENLAKSIESVLTPYFQEFDFLTSLEAKHLCQEALNIIVFKNRHQHQKIFNPKPAWLLLSDNHDEAITLLDDQITSIENYLKAEHVESLDKTQLRELLEEHFNLTNQLIGALFLQGEYDKLQLAIKRYSDFTASFHLLDQGKRDKEMQKFNAGIAHLMVEINIDDDIKTQEWIKLLPKEYDHVRLLSLAISETKRGMFSEAREAIKSIHQITLREIQTTIEENYQRSYEEFVILMQILHLQQVIEIKELDGSQHDARIKQLLKQETQRLMNIHPNIDYWQTILKIRHLLELRSGDEPIHVEYAMLCIKNKRFLLAREILDGIIGETPENNLRIHKNPQREYYIESDNYDVLIPEIKHSSAEVIYAYAKLLLADGKIENKIAGYVHLLRLLYNDNINLCFCEKIVKKIIHWLNYFGNRQQEYQLRDDNEYKSLVNESIADIYENCSASVTSDLPDPSEVTTSSSISRSEIYGMAPDKNSLVHSIVEDITCRFTEEGDTSAQEEELLILERAAAISDNNENIMFLSAQVSYELYQESLDQCSSVSIGHFANSESVSAFLSSDSENIGKTQRITKALQFYFECQRSPTYRVQSGLMILQIIYDSQLGPSSDQLLHQLFEASKPEHWLPVLPQIITYSMNKAFSCARFLNQILLSLATTHYQLVLPELVVAAFTEDIDMEEEIAKIIDIALRNEPDGGAIRLMELNKELARVAYSLLEETYDSLQMCIPLLDSDEKHVEFFEMFSDLYQSLETSVDVAELDHLSLQFTTTVKPMLDQAWELFKDALVYKSASLLDDVKSMLIDISCKVWEEISEEGVLELESLSPYLFNLRYTTLMIPGTQQLLESASPTIYINRVIPRMTVIESKERPRKLAFVGSDGEVYAYLLKGKEDLRQDERVMQFLRFTDSLMYGELQQLRLHAYPVIPLTNQSGLIFWVPNTNSLENLIQQQKLKQNDYDLQIEFRAAHYSVLSLPQRMDALKFAIREIPPTALNQALFALSNGSEDYIRARGSFTQTLAAASATGHVLGLGDRHPGNILLNREMHVVHIDYGDCFEIAMKREKFPERVVFRLTAMLEAALDICGKHGAFSLELIRVLELLRDNQLFVQAIFKGYLDRDSFATLRTKLEGREKWNPDMELSTEQQAEALISSASNIENLCQAYFGWAPFW